MLTQEDKQFLKDLIKQEIKAFEEDKLERSIFPQIIAVEEKYDQYLHNLLKKL